jgi:hypothetical protein
MRACHPEERSSGAIADERERFLRDGRQHQLTFLPRRQRLTGLRIDDLGQEVIFLAAPRTSPSG